MLLRAFPAERRGKSAVVSPSAELVPGRSVTASSQFRVLRRVWWETSVCPFQTSEIGRKQCALILGQRQKLKSVVISTAVPHDCPHLPNHGRHRKGKGQREDFTHRELL